MACNRQNRQVPTKVPRKDAFSFENESRSHLSLPQENNLWTDKETQSKHCLQKFSKQCKYPTENIINNVWECKDNSQGIWNTKRLQHIYTKSMVNFFLKSVSINRMKAGRIFTKTASAVPSALGVGWMIFLYCPVLPNGL